MAGFATPVFSGLDGLRHGAFICWTTSTFSAKRNQDIEADWPTDAEMTPLQFAPPDYTEEQLREKTDAWVRVAVDAGMTHILLLTKHMDGLCLWDTSYPAGSPFKVTSQLRAAADPPILHRDVIKAASESCAKYGMKLALYYCLRDKQNGWDLALAKNHLRELVTNYGPIEYLWLDVGYGDQQGDEDKLELANYLKLPPPDGIGRTNLAVGFNGGGGVHDFFGGEYAQPRPNPPGRIHEFCFPLESGLRFRGLARWHYTAGEEGKCMSAEDVWDYCERAREYGNIFDINVGPDRRGDFRPIDVDCLQRAGRMIWVNDDHGPVYGGPGRWASFVNRGVGDFGDDAHFTTSLGDYCEYTFTGVGIDVITEQHADMGKMDVFIDGVLRTNHLSLYHPPPGRLVRQTVFSVSDLAPGKHTIRLQNSSWNWIGVDAFRVHPIVETGPAKPTRLSVAADGTVWVVDENYRVWRSNLPNANPISSWERIQGTARDIGCGGRGTNAAVWKIGTGLLDREQWPQDYALTLWEPQPFYGDDKWASLAGVAPGAGTRVDVGVDGSVWIVNSGGLISRFSAAGWGQIPPWLGTPATDIGCRPVGGAMDVAKVGNDYPLFPLADHGIAKWNGAQWVMKTGGGVAIDVASNGDLWVVNSVGEVWRYRESLEPRPWTYKGGGARDIACGADGSVWYAGTDNKVKRFPREGLEKMDPRPAPSQSSRGQ